MKKLLISLVFVLALSACSSAPKETLKVFNWGEYIDESLLTEFEREYNVNIVYETFDSNESMYIKLQTGSHYDVIVPSDYMIQRLIEEDFLMEIDVSELENLDGLMPETLNKAYDPEMKYSVPLYWGDFGIVYNKTVVDKEDVESQGWEVLLNTKYANSLYMYDSERDSFTPALISLGYSLNTESETELREAADWLKRVNSSMQPVYAGDDSIDQMINESKDMALMYSGDAAYVMTENENLDYYVPVEGSNVWQDAMVIPKNADNPELAMKFMDFLLRPESALANTEYVGYRTVIQEVYDEVVGQGGLFEGNVAYLMHNDGKLEEFYYNAKTREIMSELWSEVKIGH